MHRSVTVVVIGVVLSFFAPTAARAQATATGATQKPPAAARPPAEKDWEGFYAGANLGLTPRSFDVGSSTETINQISGINVAGRGVVNVPATTATLPASSPGDTAFLAGVLAGYNRMFRDQWLGGVEGNIDFGFGSTSSTFTTTLPATLLTPGVPVTFDRSARTNFMWSLRARAGYLHNDYLIYGTAGLAGARMKLDATDTWTNVPGGPASSPDGLPAANLGPLGPYVTTVSETHHRVGFTFGVGVEKPITDRFVAGAEYRHTSFGTADYTLANPTIAINGPLPPGGSSAQALPGPTTLSLGENRISVRLTLKLPFWQ